MGEFTDFDLFNKLDDDAVAALCRSNRMTRRQKREEPFELEVSEVKAETEKAILCVTEDFGEVWVPKSQVTEDSLVYAKGHAGTLQVTGWIAKEKGWL